MDTETMLEQPRGRRERAITMAAALAALVCIGGALFVGPATATYPGTNGPIAYVTGGNLHVHDGASDQVIVPSSSAFATDPDWSPDGTKLAFESLSDIYTVDADGSNLTNITNTPATSERTPSWSPAGDQIAFASLAGGVAAIEVVDDDGGNRQQLKTSSAFLNAPAWDPSGNTIVYVAAVASGAGTSDEQIFAMNSDGSGSNQLTSADESSRDPDYSPDGSQIVFVRFNPPGSTSGADLWVMNADGSNQHRLYTSGSNPSWAPDGTQIVFAHPSGVAFAAGDGSSSAPTLGPTGDEPDWGSVTPPPSDQPISAAGIAVSGTEGSALTSTSVATFTDADAGAVPAGYSAQISWGDGGTSAGSISGSAGSFAVSGTHTYATYGSYTVEVTITDLDHPSDTATTSAGAVIADAAISATGKSLVSPTAFSGAVSSFTDANPFGDVSEFTASIDWGDGTASSTGTVVAGVDGYDVSGSHAYAASGSYTVDVAITSVGGSTATAETTILVYGVPARGGFVIGDGNAAIGSAVTFWGSKWSKLNSLSGGVAPSSFKGFAASPPTSPGCGQLWSTTTGNSPPPPAGPLPEYMAVAVSSSITAKSTAITGNAVHVVVVRTAPGYAPDPALPGAGTVVAPVC